MTVPLLAIAGTHGWRPGQQDAWYQHDSPWWTQMRALGFAPRAPRPFVWTTDVGGWQFWRRWIGDRGDHHAWRAAAENLYDFLVPPLAPEQRSPPAHTHLVVHSHALNVVLYAAAEGLRIQTLTSICSPVRGDMQLAALQARPNIRFWQHVHTDGSDRWQVLGGLGDGRVGIYRAQPRADVNHVLPKIGHTGILTDPALFGVWTTLGGAIRRWDGVTT
jgi:hypothetical protein